MGYVVVWSASPLPLFLHHTFRPSRLLSLATIMKLQALAALLPLLVAVNAEQIHKRHADIAKRQSASASATGASSAAASGSGASAAGATAAPTGSAGAASDVGLTSTPTPTQSDVPALASIFSGMSSGTTWGASTTYTPGATAPVSGAPAIPSACALLSSRHSRYTHSTPSRFPAGRLAPSGSGPAYGLRRGQAMAEGARRLQHPRHCHD